ncbi:uncharacterized protein LOC143485334 [Brachyhypopomus gauderio]|uniref:uncharacterized protein LOC143485334 n=1 Tax=Brachyhypopomus gauderio TaxID=698409 RepID=UPI00404208A0
MHLTDWNYSNLDDAHMTGFFSQPYKQRILIKHGLITPDEKKQSLKEFMLKAWELNQQFQLEALEKEVIRELYLEGHDQRHLEDLSRSGSSRPLPITTVSSILSYYESNSESDEEASSLVITGENLHNLTRRVTSLVGEIKESLVPVLPALLHSTTSGILENRETALRVVEIITIKIIMETFRVSRSSPEPASVLHQFYSVTSTHPQRQFLLWLRSSIMEIVMGLLFPQEVIDVRDAARAEHPAGSLGTTEASTPAMPKMESTPVGSKPKKAKKVHGFFRRAWQAVKKTFCFGK